MTLSRFLRDYLYIPLGGNRKGRIRKHLNLLVTMLLGGLWHGAGWTFVVWGGLHGLYLILNHAFITFRQRHFSGFAEGSVLFSLLSTLLTFMAVMVAWVFFRAHTFEQAVILLQGMLGGTNLANAPLISYYESVLLILFSCVVVWGLPNSIQYIKRLEQGEDSQAVLKLSLKHRLMNFNFNRVSGLVVGILFLLCLMAMQSVQKSEFLYYDF